MYQKLSTFKITFLHIVRKISQQEYSLWLPVWYALHWVTWTHTGNISHYLVWLLHQALKHLLKDFPKTPTLLLVDEHSVRMLESLLWSLLSIVQTVLSNTGTLQLKKTRQEWLSLPLPIKIKRFFIYKTNKSIGYFFCNII